MNKVIENEQVVAEEDNVLDIDDNYDEEEKDEEYIWFKNDKSIIYVSA